MVVAVHNSQKPKESAVELAIAAIEGRPSTLNDPKMAKVSPGRTSPGLPDEGGRIADKVRRRILWTNPLRPGGPILSSTATQADETCGSPTKLTRCQFAWAWLPPRNGWRH